MPQPRHGVNQSVGAVRPLEMTDLFDIAPRDNPVALERKLKREWMRRKRMSESYLMLVRYASTCERPLLVPERTWLLTISLVLWQSNLGHRLGGLLVRVPVLTDLQPVRGGPAHRVLLDHRVCVRQGLTFPLPRACACWP